MVAHRFIVHAAVDNITLGNDVTHRIQTCVNDSLATTLTHNFQFGNHVRQFQQALAALKQVCAEVGFQTIANHRIVIVSKLTQRVNLLGRQEL